MEHLKSLFTSNSNQESDNIFNKLIPKTESSSWFDKFTQTSELTDGKGSLGEFFELDLATRMKAFFWSVIMSFVLFVLAMISIWILGIKAFAVLYTGANISGILALMFLIGPMRQLRMMFKIHRIISTIIFLVTLVLTLLSAFWWKNTILCLVFTVIQMCALIWYYLSYIPAGQFIAGKCCGACCSSVSQIV